jgi:SseB protein N-terminal domain
MRPQLLLRRLWCPSGYRHAGPIPAGHDYSEAVPELAAGNPSFRADTGEADPAVAAALTAFSAGEGTEQATLDALSGSRLLVPVVAVPGEEDAAAGIESRGETGSEMATPAIVGRDGRAALPAFTSLRSLLRWQSGARPVPVPARSVWQSAVAQAQAVIIDIAGPVPLAVDGARLVALAQGTPIPALHEDPDVHAVVAAAAAVQPPGIRVRLGPGRDGTDLTLLVGWAEPAASGPDVEAVGKRLAADIAARLGGRLSRGIALVLPSAEASR